MDRMLDHVSALLWRHYGAVALLAVILGTTLGLCASEPALAPERTPALPSGRWVIVEATAYCGGPCKICQTTGTTANNTRCSRVPYAIAADRSLPFGRSVYVPPGLGYLDRLRPLDRLFTIDDRGGALDSEAGRRGLIRLDLRFIDHADAARFGRRLLPVFLCD